MNAPRNPAAAEALESTNRPEASDDFPPNDTLGPTPDGEEDTSLRELEPRSVEGQFGSKPDIEPEGDQEKGAEKWYEQSREMKDSFPDAGND